MEILKLTALVLVFMLILIIPTNKNFKVKLTNIMYIFWTMSVAFFLIMLKAWITQ